ncbi:DNA topoisomerase IV, alpha subunit [Ascodesmis nigricans]|uniref:DNA topoisomerase (ATP-hydrolyzing) n=1 Tax=Ascodesmis nigricans TaxID=341454 RepID=A0A4S2N735_9PEZI|nr:DNA topoisomerase IV, alpha subunit [Ascodesmis nigricans]
MDDQQYILDSITKTLQLIHTNFTHNQPASLTLANRRNGSPTRTISFPGRTAHEAHQFASILKIMDIIHDCITTGTTITKRDVYYRHVSLFKSQSSVDRLVDDLAATFGVSRSCLHVVGASKGMVYGAMTIRMRDGTSVRCDEVDNGGGVLIPTASLISSVDVPNEIRWCVVVEKDAVFKTICSELRGFLKTRCVFVTGKGYPDVATRELSWRLATTMHRVKVVCLVDYDPDGYEILNTYRNGSRAMAHEADLAANNIQCIGVKGAHLAEIIRLHGVNTGGGHIDLPTLSPRDRRKAHKMLDRLAGDTEICGELKRMLFVGVKAEIEAIDNLHNWLEHAVMTETL